MFDIGAQGRISQKLLAWSQAQTSDILSQIIWTFFLESIGSAFMDFTTGHSLSLGWATETGRQWAYVL